MKSLGEARSIAKTQNTKAVLQFRRNAKWTVRIIIWSYVIVRALQYTADWQEERAQKQAAEAAHQAEAGKRFPMLNGDPSNWIKVRLGPGEKSRRFQQPVGMRVMVDGNGFRYHCVYRNGTEQSFVRGEKPCPGGDMPFVYVSNLTNTPIEVTVSYELLR